MSDSQECALIMYNTKVLLTVLIRAGGKLSLTVCNPNVKYYSPQLNDCTACSTTRQCSFQLLTLATISVQNSTHSGPQQQAGLTKQTARGICIYVYSHNGKSVQHSSTGPLAPVANNTVQPMLCQWLILAAMPLLSGISILPRLLGVKPLAACTMSFRWAFSCFAFFSPPSKSCSKASCMAMQPCSVYDVRHSSSSCPFTQSPQMCTVVKIPS